MEKVSVRRPIRKVLILQLVIAAVLGMAAGNALSAGALIDINSADQKSLESLPGVGPATAQEIIKGRPYRSVDDLGNVKGIGKSKLEKIRPLVTVGGQPAAKAPAAAPPAATKVPTTADQGAKGAPAETKKAARAAIPAGPVNINTASKEQLEALPGIGPSKAQAIIDGRPYQKTEDIMKVKGIKQKTYDKIKDLITVR